jgi:hypothetical protein
MMGSWASLIFEPSGLGWLFAFCHIFPILAVYFHFVSKLLLQFISLNSSVAIVHSSIYHTVSP